MKQGKEAKLDETGGVHHVLPIGIKISGYLKPENKLKCIIKKLHAS